MVALDLMEVVAPKWETHVCIGTASNVKAELGFVPSVCEGGRVS